MILRGKLTLTNLRMRLNQSCGDPILQDLQKASDQPFLVFKFWKVIPFWLFFIHTWMKHPRLVSSLLSEITETKLQHASHAILFIYFIISFNCKEIFASFIYLINFKYFLCLLSDPCLFCYQLKLPFFIELKLLFAIEIFRFSNFSKF